MTIFINQKQFHQILTKKKFMKGHFLLHFINSAINEFQKSKECENESFIIPPGLFKLIKPFISIEITYCELDEIKLQPF